MENSDLCDEEFLFRVYSFLSVALSHLSRNFDLHQRIRPNDLLECGRPHWGSLPGVSAVYAARRLLMRRTTASFEIVLGTGHAGLPALIDAFLFSDLSISGVKFAKTLTGFSALSKTILAGERVSSEVGPNYPFPSYPTGNIGHGLGYAQGFALANPGTITLAILGDGECEAGSTLSALFSQSPILSKIPGLIPVINMNGLRMGGPSALSILGQDAVRDLLISLHFEPLFVDLTMHDLALKLGELCIFDGGALSLPSGRIIVLQGPKGYSGPHAIGDHVIIGKVASHKSPILCFKDREEAAATLDHWLRSYAIRPFDAEGNLSLRVKSMAVQLSGREPEEPRQVDALSAYQNVEFVENGPPVLGLRNFIIAKCRDGNDFKIFSPDEASSNLGVDFVEALRGAQNDDGGESHQAGPLLEVLNEDLCLAWLIGWRSAGKSGLMITYEAFAPILINQILQIRKFMRDWRNSGDRRNFSLTIVLSSLGWRNTPSHHETFFSDSLASLIEPGLLDIRFPIDAKSTFEALQKAHCSQSGINIVIVDKHAEFNDYNYVENDHQPRRILRFGETSAQTRNRILIVSIGNIAFEQSNIASMRFVNSHPDHLITHFCCEDLAILFKNENSIDSELQQLLSDSEKVVWVINGRARAFLNSFKAITPAGNALSVLGFLDNDLTRSGLVRMTANAVDASAILDALANSPSVSI